MDKNKMNTSVILNKVISKNCFQTFSSHVYETRHRIFKCYLQKKSVKNIYQISWVKHFISVIGFLIDSAFDGFLTSTEDRQVLGSSINTEKNLIKDISQ